MHELALTEELLAAALEAAQRAGACAIRRLHLVLSSASHIEPETVRLHFALVSQGTPAEGAELVFTRRSVEKTCRYCARKFVVTADLTCPACGAPALPEPPDPEMTLEDIEVDVPAG
ncbi:MAG: hydrogenase/urease maturation nickel metallochaperone HypA [Armatimonadota bacterium]|nr:hydrogenase/urease maturation nickel metallochaperone HypA [Armatimonadota bacterium]MDR7426642.1 hydrogenase/urease maturation nickel metallochaperone HypA [Armatimonadota bacterium]MDR7463651.1 hydrogenase/urease maturation nickel metallochaperone HypA [Armatimonadota bacterium]MDR7468662.1 hydrogenase/urease maturation nickel metallochaperone HypA [Armatimonadota bacterium]MDR7473785.1 hydrogenase/urease maturation nickel metallochaperone HypA [Armatimonadota bacterium]